MSLLRAILHELIGLFVDDGALALALVVCCAAIGALTLALPALPPILPGGLLVAGCIAILLANIATTIRKRR